MKTIESIAATPGAPAGPRVPGTTPTDSHDLPLKPPGTREFTLRSVVVAILVYALLAWAIARFVEIVFYRNVTVSKRSSGLRPRGF